MGKASKFFKTLIGFKATNPPQSPSASSLNKQPKRRWSFIKLHHNSFHHSGGGNETTASNDHAVAVAAATAAVAEAAVAAAEAAAEVVRMTSRGTAGYSLPGEWAAIKIQSCFRAYLARKALRALKALVKLQALVRGYIQRKSDADDMRRRQALLRVQARARARAHARRLLIATDSPNSHSTTKGPPTPEKYEHVLPKHHKPSPLKNNGLRSEKILEIDTTKPYIFLPRPRNLFHPDHVSQSLTTSRGWTVQPSGSCEVNSMEEETVQNSPLLYASMRVSPFTVTPSKSESWDNDHPSYMAYTESSRAKVRSVSAHRQRPQLETTKRYLGYGGVRDSFVNKAYPGSGRLDRLGMPIGEVSGSYWN